MDGLESGSDAGSGLGSGSGAGVEPGRGSGSGAGSGRGSGSRSGVGSGLASGGGSGVVCGRGSGGSSGVESGGVEGTGSGVPSVGVCGAGTGVADSEGARPEPSGGVGRGCLSGCFSAGPPSGLGSALGTSGGTGSGFGGLGGAGSGAFSRAARRARKRPSRLSALPVSLVVDTIRAPARWAMRPTSRNCVPASVCLPRRSWSSSATRRIIPPSSSMIWPSWATGRVAGAIRRSALRSHLAARSTRSRSRFQVSGPSVRMCSIQSWIPRTQGRGFRIQAWMASRPGGFSGRTTSLSGSGTESSPRRLRSDMPGQGYARWGAIRVVEACCNDVIVVDVTSSLTSVTGAVRRRLRPVALVAPRIGAFGEPVGVSYPHSGGRRASVSCFGIPPSSSSLPPRCAAIRIRGSDERQLSAFGGVGGGQLSAFRESVGASYTHSRSRWASAIRIRGAGERQLSAFGGAGGRQLSAFGGVRWASAIRIQGAGGRELHAFEEPVDVSYPHSGGPPSAMRIRKAGGRQLCAFGESVNVSHPHSGGR